MQVSEILKGIAEIVAQAENVAADGDQEMNIGADSQVEPASSTQLMQVDIDDTDGTEPETMISPLQQEHELLKKLQGVDNNIEEFADAIAQVDAEVGHADMGESENDDLDKMKKMAGIGNEQQAPHNHAESCRTTSLNPRANAALEANGKAHLKHTHNAVNDRRI